MKAFLTNLFVFLAVLLNAQISFDPDKLTEIAKRDRENFFLKTRHKPTETISGYNVKWYRCYWKMDPNFDSIAGSVTTMFAPVAGPMDSLVLDLNDALTVDSVIFHGSLLSFSHSSGLLEIPLPSPVAAEVLDSITVFYHGVPPGNGFGSFVQSEHNGVPEIWTLSEPYGASDWWPCKNDLTDKTDSVDIYIQTPSQYRSASNGILVSSDTIGGDVIYHWKHRYPIASYLICLGVTNYAHFLQQVPYGSTTLNVENFVYPEDSASAAQQTGSVISMIQLYDTLFGIYPFQNEKYGHAQFGWGGGMENQTMTFVTNFGFELIAHELGHQWFGDKVTCGSWSDIWLNEGFATYLSGLCYEHLLPQYWERFREVRVKSIISKPGGSVFCTDTTDINRIFDTRLSYAKGAMVLHQLRWILGDSVFFAALNNYLSDANVAYGFARTPDLQSHLENASGHDLTWYFDDWYTGQGYPSYTINWNQEADTLSFAITQSQSDPSVTFFELPVQLEFKSSSHDTLIRFTNTFSGQTFDVILPFTADSVIFDPGYNIISGNNLINSISENNLLHQLEIYPVPANDKVMIRFPEILKNEFCIISVYNNAGILVGEQKAEKGSSSVILNTQTYPAGMYYCRIFSGDELWKGKFQIVR
jgi:aminopeptidase N